MSFRILIWILLVGATSAGGVAAWRDGSIQAWSHWARELTAPSSTAATFKQSVIGQINSARGKARLRPLQADTELDTWLAENLADMPMEDMDTVTKRLQEALPRYFRVAVCSASSPATPVLLQQLRDFSQRTQPEMTHGACVLRRAVGGLTQQALVVVGQRLQDFSPEVVTASPADAYFSTCPHCRHPHVVRVSRQQRSLGLECPMCRKTYAVVASDLNNRMRYVNEFLTGYAPPAVFARDQSRLSELFTIWSAVSENCAYTKDPGLRRDQTDSWQTALETQRLGQGDCEDSSIFLCDWLLSRGFDARVALGRYGDLGGHAWCVVRIEGREYLLESTEGRPDTGRLPLVEDVGSRYVPEVLFDRFALYVRGQPGQSWRGGYWAPQDWARVEPRWAAGPNRSVASKVIKHLDLGAKGTLPRMGLARTSQPNPAAAPFMDFEDIPPDADIWEMPLPVQRSWP